MQYDGVKSTLNRLINKNKLYRKAFYFLLDCLILRQWYVKRAIRRQYRTANMGGVILDAGSGFCQYTDYMLNRYEDSSVVAMDLKSDYLCDYSQSLTEKQRKRFSYSVGDLQDTQPTMKDAMADIVLAIDILEHIPDDIAVLTNFYHTMSNDAVLVISTPTNLDDTASFTDEHVRMGYSAEELFDKLQSTGFEVIHHEYSYGVWGKLYWKLIMRNSITMLNFSKLLYLFLPFYLLLVYPLSFLFMCLDFWCHNKIGNGIVVVIRRKKVPENTK